MKLAETVSESAWSERTTKRERAAKSRKRYNGKLALCVYQLNSFKPSKYPAVHIPPHSLRTPNAFDAKFMRRKTVWPQILLISHTAYLSLYVCIYIYFCKPILIYCCSCLCCTYAMRYALSFNHSFEN